ncbi:MAG: hypothetical protein R3F31_18270 [Verrucomicrobiales bacterium]
MKPNWGRKTWSLCKTRISVMSAPGELISVGETKFDLDKTPRGPQQAGAVTGVGQGGDAVWRESLVPAEREVLKKFFKKPETAK